jgi:hypothetical protein
MGKAGPGSAMQMLDNGSLKVLEARLGAKSGKK